MARVLFPHLFSSPLSSLLHSSAFSANPSSPILHPSLPLLRAPFLFIPHLPSLFHFPRAFCFLFLGTACAIGVHWQGLHLLGGDLNTQPKRIDGNFALCFFISVLQHPFLCCFSQLILLRGRLFASTSTPSFILMKVDRRDLFICT